MTDRLNAARPPAQAETPVEHEAEQLSEETFAKLMRHRMDQSGMGGAADKAAQLRTAAEEMVATTFVAPMLAMARDHSLGAGPFAPTTAEKRMGPMLDQHIADRVVQASDWPLVDSIIERYQQHEAAGGELTNEIDKPRRLA